MDEGETLASFDRHRMQPDVMPSVYFHSLCLDLGKQVASKRRIYLDTCYWVHLRLSALGKARRPEYGAILDLLRSLVRSGQVICPVSTEAFIEAMQHVDETTRLQTAVLFDELSGGVAQRPESERVEMEIDGFLRFIWKEPSLHHQLMWVRPGFVLGVKIPSIAKVSEGDNRAIAKSFLDTLWNFSFQELAKQDKRDNFASVMQGSAERVNENNAAYASTVLSFKDALANEISGVVSFFDERAVKVVLDKKYPAYTDEEAGKFKDLTRTMMFNTFLEKPELMAKHIPALYVHAACHAAVRWDKTRKVNGHWLVDFHHACAACGRHEAMFTEKPLKVLMTNGNLRLNQDFNLRVLADPAEVVQYLRDLAAELGLAETSAGGVA